MKGNQIRFNSTRKQKSICVPAFRNMQREARFEGVHHLIGFFQPNTEKYFLNLVNMNRASIVIALFWYIWRHTKFMFVPNELEKSVIKF